MSFRTIILLEYSPKSLMSMVNGLMSPFPKSLMSMVYGLMSLIPRSNVYGLWSHSRTQEVRE